MSKEFEILFTSLKDDMQKGFDKIEFVITELKNSIEKDREKSEVASKEIAVIQNDIKNIKKDLNEYSKKNDNQHSEFYANDKNQDKFIYKLTGALVFVSFAIGTSLKLAGIL